MKIVQLVIIKIIDINDVIFFAERILKFGFFKKGINNIFKDFRTFKLPKTSNISLVIINTTNMLTIIPALRVTAKPRMGPLPCQNKIIAVNKVVTFASRIVLKALLSSNY